MRGNAGTMRAAKNIMGVRMINVARLLLSMSTLFAITLLSISTHILANDVIPVADFHRRPAFAGAVISPSGKHVGAAIKGGPKGRFGLVVFDVSDLAKTKAVALYSDADVTDIKWVNDDRLVFSVIDFQAPVGEQIGGGLFVVDREGKEQPRNLVRRRYNTDESGGVVSVRGTRIADSGLSAFHHMYSTLRDGSNNVVLIRADVDDRGDLRSTALVRLDTVSGAPQNITSNGPDHVFEWALDHRGNARAAVSSREGKSRLHWRVTAEAPWTLARTWDTFAELHEAPTPMAVDDRDRLYVTAREDKDADITALIRVDMVAPTPHWQTLMSLTGFDFSGRLEMGADGQVLGIRTLTDARGTHWFDATLKTIQGDIDKLLPSTLNEIKCGNCKNLDKVMVVSLSDRQPPVTRLFDTKAKTFQTLGAARPWIKTASMARREMLRFVARDGLSVPVHVTRPANQKGPAPTVVLVHGGPYVRGGEWQWDADSQFLASRGYVVIEPEFRGSVGFGYKHFQAGWKQWGLAMQDDIADATQWAIKQGYADERRICIAGASYGGYATLMGLVRYPELYRCGINWVGVTDMDLLYTARWSDFSVLWKSYGMPKLVGDREKDAAQFAETSPLRQAAKITQPLLMAYGDADRRVPIAHGERLRSALEKHNRAIEWITYKDEGHGWMLESNNVDFWTRVEKFLNTNLKAP